MVENISVDEPLISTDVDTLIKAIAYKKDLDVPQLAAKTNIDQATVEKWLRILEEEGYIQIHYNLTNMRISWIKQETGSQRTTSSAPQYEKQETQVPIPSPITAPITHPEIKLQPTQTPPSEVQIPVLVESQEKKEVTSLLEEELKRESMQTANPINKVLSSNDIKFNILKEMEKDWQEEKQSIQETTTQEPEQKPKTPVLEVTLPTPKIEVEPPTSKKQEKPEIIAAESQKTPSQANEPEQNAVRENINQYLNEISEQRKQIAQLKAQKEEMYGKKLLPLENKFETISITFSEKILEKEEKILSLKDRMVRLPSHYAEVEKLRSSVEKIEYNAINSLDQARTSIDSVLESIKKKEAEAYSKMTSGLAALEDERKRLGELEGIAQGLGTKVAKVETLIKETQGTIDQLFQSMKNLEDDIALARRKQEEVVALSQETQSAIDAREEEIQGLTTQIDELRSVEQWIMDYVKDYHKKLDDLHAMVNESKEELASLEETAEIEQLKNYLDELETITEMYSEETQNITAQESSIDRRIHDSQEKLGVLITESRDLIRRLRKDVKDTPYMETMERAETTVKKMQSVVETKQKERMNLEEELAKRKAKRKDAKKDSKDKKGKK